MRGLSLTGAARRAKNLTRDELDRTSRDGFSGRSRKNFACRASGSIRRLTHESRAMKNIALSAAALAHFRRLGLRRRPSPARVPPICRRRPRRRLDRFLRWSERWLHLRRQQHHRPLLPPSRTARGAGAPASVAAAGGAFRRPVADQQRRLHRRRPDRLQLAVLQQLRRRHRSRHPGHRRLKRRRVARSPPCRRRRPAAPRVTSASAAASTTRHGARPSRLARHARPCCSTARAVSPMAA